MAPFEKVFLFASLVTGALCSIFFIYGLVFNKSRLNKVADFLVFLFLALITLTIVVRWTYQGHGPYITLYEVLLSNVWITICLYLIFCRIWKKLNMVGAFAMPVIFLTLGAVIMSPAEISNFTPSYRSIWLIMHVLFAKLTYGSILIASALSFSIILRKYLDSKKYSFVDRLPESDKADLISYKLIATSLFFSSIMLVSGSIWANQLWGKYWGWDPVEVWALITWVVYGLYLHLRVTYKFSGIPASFYVIAAFFISVFSFFIMPYFLTTIHNSFMFAR
jgi:cytochrome c-type biogenesis protein CcsB